MPTYYALVNVRYPADGLECHGTFTNEAEARQLIEKELTDLYGSVWERSNSTQYAKKDDLAAIFVMALLDIRYSDEEQERDELDSLPKRIADLQTRLAELQKKYAPPPPEPEGATCPDCNQNMMKSDGCTKETIHLDGKAFQRIRYGHEGRAPYGRDDSGRILADKRCHDCNCKTLQLHHLGCDVEECPKCHGQLISCGCWDDTEEDQ